mgnify:CR=1 FL=1
MAVNVHRCGDAPVAEPFGDNLRVNTLVDEQRRRGMPEIMEPNISKAVFLDELTEPQIGTLMVKWRAVGVGENEEPLPALPGVTKLVPLPHTVSVIVLQFLEH